MQRTLVTLDVCAWALAALLLAIALAGCHAPVRTSGAVVRPAAWDRHDIGPWADDDEVCVPLPSSQALYTPRACLSMRAIRQLILATRAGNEDPQ
jgi:hypothetical protein